MNGKGDTGPTAGPVVGDDDIVIGSGVGAAPVLIDHVDYRVELCQPPTPVRRTGSQWPPSFLLQAVS